MIYVIIIAKIIAVIIGMFLFRYAGYVRAFFECILLFDSVKKHLGNYYSFDLFKSNKDRNNDGKISFIENAFPNDGGHELKHYETGCILLACLVPIFLVWWLGIIYLIVGFWFRSFAFEISFKKYKL